MDHLKDRLGDLPLRAVVRRGNGFAIGEVTGCGVVRWSTLVRIRLAVRS